MILSGNPYYKNTSLTYIHATSSAEISSVHATKYPHFVNLFTITNITLCSCPVTGFFDFGNLIIKSYNMTSHSLFSVSTGCNFLNGLCLENLFLWQSGHSLVTFLAIFYMFLIMYSCLSLATNAVVLLCLCVVLLWNSVTNSSAILFGTYIASNCVSLFL